jgi:hypothetical protein
MKYICLVYHEEHKLDALPPAELEALVRECGAWIKELGDHHVISAGLQCVKTAATVRNRNGKISISDGPFAETKEFLRGFTLINARDLNEAIQMASKLPAARLGSIEVRPVLEPDSESTDPLDRKLAAVIRHLSHP